MRILSAFAAAASLVLLCLALSGRWVGGDESTVALLILLGVFGSVFGMSFVWVPAVRGQPFSRLLLIVNAALSCAAVWLLGRLL